MRLLVATRSSHKLEEIRAVLADVEGLEVLGLTDVGIEPDPREEDLEPFDDFELNARSKAMYFHGLTGLPTVADDSGIVVDALGGAPGPRSRRFAPEGYRDIGDRDLANNRYLLDRLADVPSEQRTARYVCLAWYRDEFGNDVAFEGVVEGRIAGEASGSGGFGYDPLFLVPELGRTFGDSDPEAKLRLSHRGRAFRALGEALRGAATGSNPTGGSGPFPESAGTG